MKTTRTNWNFVNGFGIKHVSNTDIWSVLTMPDFEFVTSFCSLQRAKTYCKNQTK